MIARIVSTAALAAALAACAPPAPDTGTSVQEVLVISPSTWDFGQVPVGDTSTPRTIVIAPANTGFEDDVVNSVTSPCADFVVDTSTLDNPAEVYRRCINLNAQDTWVICPDGFEVQSQVFSVSFQPSFAGTQSCPITIDMAGAGARIVNLSGTGLAPPIALSVVTPSSPNLDFGEVVVGSASGALPVTLRSDGTGPLDLFDATIDGPDAAAFALTTSDSEPLNQGETFTWQLTCTPPGPTALTATLTITSNAPDSPHTIALTCTGIQSNLLVGSPVQFDEVLIGASSTVTIQLTNAGTAELHIASTQVVEGPFTAPELGGTVVSPGVGAELPITFTPTAADAGTDVHGTLLITFDGGETRTVELIGPARDAALSLTPGGTIDFGTVCAGQSREQLFVALNTGSGGAELTLADVTGPGFTLTLIAPTALPAPLPARGSGSVTFRVTATPPTGEATGEVTVAAAIPDSAPAVVGLHAIGQDSGVGASPLAVDFGGVVVAEPSGGRTVRISNCDATPLEVTTAALAGPDAREFVLVSEDPLPVTLPAGATATFIVELRPTTAGDKSATLEIVHGQGTTAIPLTGIGVGEPTGGGGGGRGSYYACSAGGGAGGLAPLGLALAWLIVRRRRSCSAS